MIKSDSLQEVVGQPLSEERKQDIIMSYVYNEQMHANPDVATTTPVRQEEKNKASTTSASRKSKSASRGSTPALVKKTIAKPRELQRRHSGTDKPPMRDLFGDFMDADKPDDEGKELWTEEEPRAAAQAQQPAAAKSAGA